MEVGGGMCTIGEHLVLTILGKPVHPEKAPPHTTGPIERVLEHLTLTQHPEHRDGKRKRYRLARKHPLSEHCFLVLQSRGVRFVRAAETLLINTSNACGNN